MDLNFNSRRNLAGTLAKRVNLKLVERDDIQVPYTDSNTIFVKTYNPDWDWNSDDCISWWKSFLHEIFHNIHIDDFAVLKRENVNMKSKFGFVHNINLDHNIEYCCHDMFPGISKIMLKGYNLLAKRVISARGSFDETDSDIDAVMGFDILCRKTWNRSITCEEDFLNMLDGDALEKLKILEPFKDEWIAKKDSEECYDLTKRVCAALGIKASKQEGSGGESGSSEEEEGQGEDGEEKEADCVVNYMDLLDHEHNSDGTIETGKSKVTIDYSDWDYYRGYKSGDFRFEKPTDTPSSHHRHNIDSIVAGNSLAKEVRKHLLIITKAKKMTGFKKGRLDSSRLWKPRVYGAYSDAGRSIHTQKVNNNILDTAILLLVDQSGSMYSQKKFEHAAKAAVLLAETLKTIRIPVEIQSFSDNGYRNINWVHKEFNEKKSEDAIIDSFCSSSHHMQSNADGEAIMQACSRVLARKEARKIMIVLSDGMPATHIGEGDIYGYTKKVVKEIEEKSPIDIYGIGIMNQSVKNIYSASSVINSADQIETELLSLLKEKVLI